MCSYMCACLCAVDMTFTTKNVQKAVQEVKDTDSLGLWLGVPRSKRNEIKRQFSSVSQLVKSYIMEHEHSARGLQYLVVLSMCTCVVLPYSGTACDNASYLKMPAGLEL